MLRYGSNLPVYITKLPAENTQLRAMCGKRKKNLPVNFLATELHVLLEHTETLEQGWDWLSPAQHLSSPFPHTGTRETG